MTDNQPPEPAAPATKPLWTPPELKLIGSIGHVAGGGNPGLDTNNLPAHS